MLLIKLFRNVASIQLDFSYDESNSIHIFHRNIDKSVTQLTPCQCIHLQKYEIRKLSILTKMRESFNASNN